ncbi:MAG: rod shape-determining protein MreC [Oscillospiraceae bacterium]|nr:rod shape-determining protein MreC [Oscillospiraceae bacterium]MBR3952453.1 rod shape-determining protein MreC [Oscillospiraceae bacterium]
MQKFFKSWYFKVLCALAVFSVALMIRAAASGSAEVFLSQAVSVVSQPFLDFSSSVTNSVNEFLDRFIHAEENYLRVQELEEELRRANEKLIDYEEKTRENEQLRTFLGLKETNPDYEFEPATVIGRDSTNRFYSFTVDRGSLHGVEKADPVITADGLVGIVWEVGLTYSHVRTILDISVEVGAYDIATRDGGIVTGDLSLSSEGICKLKYLPKESGIANGNLIVTSGIGGVFPKDLPIGRVKSIEIDPSGLSLAAEIDPIADIENISNVTIIKSFNGQSTGFSGSEEAEEGEGE